MSDYHFLSALAPRLDEFLALLPAGGRDAKSQRVLLRYLDRFLHQQHFTTPWLTREVVDEYLRSTVHLNPRTRENRWCMLRQFCRYLRQFEPQCFVPEHKPCRVPARARTAHIFSETEIQAMLRAAQALPPSGSLRAQTYFTLFGLLYTTGLRCGEAFALNVGDVDLERERLFVDRGKFGKSRWVPLSASTTRVLQRYRQERSRAAPAGAQSPFFITPHRAPALSHQRRLRVPSRPQTLWSARWQRLTRPQSASPEAQLCLPPIVGVASSRSGRGGPSAGAGHVSGSCQYRLHPSLFATHRRAPGRSQSALSPALSPE